MTEDQQEPEVHIDEDWKKQAEAEKEAYRQASGKADSSHKLPPATFAMLVSTLATQAVVALGVGGEEDGKQPVVEKEIAKHLIDTLAMLDEKTKGNLTTEEANMLSDALHQLRMLYVNTPTPKTETKKEPKIIV